MNPKISIVVPCYNVEKYIEKCVASVVNQTLKDIEIILVNDGSKDSTLKILQSFADNDSRCRVIDLPNGGYGRAVNTGLAQANGNYIGIVESDDFVTEDMFESLYALTNGGKVDVVKGNFWDFYDVDGKKPEAIVNNERHAMPDVTEPFTIRQRPELLWGHPSIWSGIYKRSLIVDNDIKFIEAKGGGWVDNPFFFETLCKAKSIMWTKKPFYFYRKTNPESSSVKQFDPTLPFVRMMDNLNVLEREQYTDVVSKKYAYARALMYLRGALVECDYVKNYDIINDYAKQLMQRLDPDVLLNEFNLQDQFTYFDYASPLKTLRAKNPKILLYNWLPFDNPWNWGGGVTLYCKNVINAMLKLYPTANIYFLSSGFAYDATTSDIFYRKIKNIFGERVHQYEIVNSPIPAEQRFILNNPLVAVENIQLKKVFADFINATGAFNAIHFNNLEGLSLDILDLAEALPKTKFIYSLHNYIPCCVTGFYYQRHNHVNCNPNHTSEDCFKCVHTAKQDNMSARIYERGLFGKKREDCMSEDVWINLLGLKRLDIPASADKMIEFANVATEKINKNCHNILAVSKRVYDIALAEGFDKSKMSVSYIGTAIASGQVGKSVSPVGDGLKVVFLGNDIENEEKGYPWLLDSLEKLDEMYASKIDLVLTLRNKKHTVVYEKLAKFRSLKIIQGYTHKELPGILQGCNLGLVPVIWEDNLPQIAIEMVAHGVPVLSSDAGGASELCKSNLFKFKAGDTEEFLQKLTTFLKEPDLLDVYWKFHSGLVTMDMHIKELIRYYGLPESKDVSLSAQDYSFLLMENAFLKRNISLNAKVVYKDREVFRDKEVVREIEKMSFRGQAFFNTSPSSSVEGAYLFRLELNKFDFSDFYAQINFVRMNNLNVSQSDILHISGTWHNLDGGYKLHIHQAEFEKKNKQITSLIYYIVNDSTVTFFTKHPGIYSTVIYEVPMTTSRVLGEQVHYFQISNGDINKNEPMPTNAQKPAKKTLIKKVARRLTK